MLEQESVEKLKASIDKSLAGKNYNYFNCTNLNFQAVIYSLAYASQNSIENLQTCSYNNPISSDKTCSVDLRGFGACNSENHYGFNKQSPCIFIKFKKVNDWVPKSFNLSALPKEMPMELQDPIRSSNRQNAWLSCHGDLPVDVEHLGPINYYPDRGYPGFFFPYTGQKDYLEPIVAVNFERPVRKLF
jgi:sodium/potassium-transporting ATPase subunit beta